MKKIGSLIIAALFASVVLTPGTAFAKKDNLKVNTENSKVEWLGKKVTGEHSGTIKVNTGSLVLNDDKIVEGSFVVDMKSIVCTDLKDEGYKTKLEGHLKSDDFFGVEKFPESKFVITTATKMDDGNYKVKGNITIKGITEEVELMVSLHKHDATVHVSGKITIDRTKFNVRYGSGSFFDNLGDKTIYDDFELNLDLYLE
ncbi:YceI family protein [Labilibaculum antarcticum]|uniref:Lipid-binding protein n=1 Tax=Labilibaculum antarcticum TaxID=1717717 RepID=A0A1Y1CRF7_9BACT|nr:YceI family protein [Labilibaculum antarcticum]BAX82573.1 lipid-binding protein [Labilibaculum antarcticum]